MRRASAAIVALVVVVGTLAAVPATGVAQETTATETATPTDSDANETADDTATAPGDMLEGVVGVQEAELEGEMETRTYGIQVAQAATADARGKVVAERLTAVEERLMALEERKQELNESRANGTISEAEYRNEIAELAVRTNTTKQLLNRSANASAGLPDETLAANGINVTAIRTLQERADELTGPEVAEIARSIAGPSAAPEAANGASERRGPPADAGGDATDRDGNRTAGGQPAETPGGGNQTAGDGRPSETPDEGSDAGSGSDSDSDSGNDSGSDAGDGGSADAGSGSGSGSGSDADADGGSGADGR